MIIPPIPQEYSSASQAIISDVLIKADDQNLKLDQDNFLATGSICLQNGDGDWFKLGVNTASTPVLTITKLTGTQIDADDRPSIASTNPYYVAP